MVEGKLLHLGAGVVRNLGWRVHIVHDQHLQRCHISANWMDGGQLS